jgi:hypothetical protein
MIVEKTKQKTFLVGILGVLFGFLGGFFIANPDCRGSES